MRDVLQFHSAFGEEVSLEEIASEIASELRSLKDEGYTFDVKPQNPFDSPLVEGHFGLIKYRSDYGRGSVIFVSVLNKFQESPWVRELHVDGPPGLGKFVYTAEVTGCEEDVEAIGISLESLFGEQEHGFGYTKASVDDAQERSRATRFPLVKGAYLSYALGLEIAKGPMADPERVESLRELNKRAWEGVRNQGAMTSLHELAALTVKDCAELVARINAWRNAK